MTDLDTRYPALTAWRRRLAAGMLGEDPARPRTWRFDHLWRVACWEATALEAEQDGQQGAWSAAMQQARDALAKGAA